MQAMMKDQITMKVLIKVMVQIQVYKLSILNLNIIITVWNMFYMVRDILHKVKYFFFHDYLKSLKTTSTFFFLIIALFSSGYLRYLDLLGIAIPTNKYLGYFYIVLFFFFFNFLFKLIMIIFKYIDNIIKTQYNKFKNLYLNNGKDINKLENSLFKKKIELNAKLNVQGCSKGMVLDFIDLSTRKSMIELDINMEKYDSYLNDLIDIQNKDYDNRNMSIEIEISYMIEKEIKNLLVELELKKKVI
jgi:type IV secretory pathway VirB3-like protein